MTDKELIKQEIEKRFNDNMKASEQYAENSKSRALFTSASKEDYDLLAFIESLPEEPASEDLEKEIGKYTTNHLLKKRNHSTKVYHLTQKDCDDIARHFTEWQKQRMIKNVVLETKVMKDNDGDGIETTYEEWLTLENTEIPYIPDNLGLKECDKVKVIILKTE